MSKYAIITWEYSKFTERELISYTWERYTVKDGSTFYNVKSVIPLRNRLANTFLEEYRPFGDIYTFEAEDDNAAKLIYEVM